MNIRYIKTGALVIGLGMVSYIFFPVNGQADKQVTRSTNSVQTNSTRPAKVTSRKSDTPRRHVTEARIEPDTALRKSAPKRRSGPPSKMYGGL
ncbi:MAG: hypothetical protein GC149_03505 [Gammaproteobacteria bacterium]|nr:hypothetical protein [Gammaproteobacteria bacterium]